MPSIVTEEDTCLLEASVDRLVFLTCSLKKGSLLNRNMADGWRESTLGAENGARLATVPTQKA